MRTIKKYYPKEDIEIVWENSKCIHSGNCARGLREVFKPREQPWIQPENATKEAIIEQVSRCPSGALSIRFIPSDEKQDQ
ncbi:MAG: (4Fe-4S)-binding protein [Chitinophagales bacterium]